jgi:hypothetical protein
MYNQSNSTKVSIAIPTDTEPGKYTVEFKGTSSSPSGFNKHKDSGSTLETTTFPFLDKILIQQQLLKEEKPT